MARYIPSPDSVYSLRFYIDLEKVRHYNRLARVRIKGDGKRLIKQTGYRDVMRSLAPWFRKHNRYYRMAVSTLLDMEKFLDVPAELIIDEERYFNRYGFAGYRVLFEALRRGIDIGYLTDPNVFSIRPESYEAWYTTWMKFFKGNVHSFGFGGKFFTMVLARCWDVLGMGVGDILARPVSRMARVGSAKAEMTDLLIDLGPREVAVVAGVAKLFAERGDLREGLARLLDWYYGGGNVEPEVRPAGDGS